jgi:hypothetical protein
MLKESDSTILFAKLIPVCFAESRVNIFCFFEQAKHPTSKNIKQICKTFIRSCFQLSLRASMKNMIAKGNSNNPKFLLSKKPLFSKGLSFCFISKSSTQRFDLPG